MHCKLKPGQRGILQQVYLTVTNTLDTTHAQIFFSDDATTRLHLQ